MHNNNLINTAQTTLILVLRLFNNEYFLMLHFTAYKIFF